MVVHPDSSGLVPMPPAQATHLPAAPWILFVVGPNAVSQADVFSQAASSRHLSRCSQELRGAVSMTLQPMTQLLWGGKPRGLGSRVGRLKLCPPQPPKWEASKELILGSMGWYANSAAPC